MAFICMSKETISSETAENLGDMLLMVCRVIGVDEDVIEVDDHMNIQEVTKNVIHKSLEGRWSIGQSEWHNKPFKGTIAGVECGLPFVTFRNADKIIGIAEIYSCVEAGLARSCQEVRDERQWIAVFLGNLVQASEVDAKAEGSVFLAVMRRPFFHLRKHRQL